MGSPEVIPFYCVLQALRQYQAKDLLLWDRPNNSVHAFYCVLHALGQYRTNRALLWDRPDLCRLNVLSGHQGKTDRCLGGLAVNVCIVFLFRPVSGVGKGRSNTHVFFGMCSLRVGLRVGCAYA